MLKAFLQTARETRKYWLWPLIFLLILLAIIVLVPSGTSDTPFTYQIY